MHHFSENKWMLSPMWEFLAVAKEEHIFLTEQAAKCEKQFFHKAACWERTSELFSCFLVQQTWHWLTILQMYMKIKNGNFQLLYHKTTQCQLLPISCDAQRCLLLSAPINLLSLWRTRDEVINHSAALMGHRVVAGPCSEWVRTQGPRLSLLPAPHWSHCCRTDHSLGCSPTPRLGQPLASGHCTEACKCTEPKQARSLSQRRRRGFLCTRPWVSYGRWRDAPIVRVRQRTGQHASPGSSCPSARTPHHMCRGSWRTWTV